MIKTLEVFFDESGDISKDEPMNISGLAVLSPTLAQREAFHAAYSQAVEGAGLSLGVCERLTDRRSSKWLAENLRPPTPFLAKRLPGEKREFWRSVRQLADIASQCAQDHQVDLLAVSLEFSNLADRRWHVDDPSIEHLLDRPYGECLKDVLEMLLFDTPRVRQFVEDAEKSILAFDFPTRRSSDVKFKAETLGLKRAQVWRQWGVAANYDEQKSPPVLWATTLGASDGIEILSGALNRRTDPAVKFMVERARGCRLIDWERWEALGVNGRRVAIESSPQPRQIHYLADLLANGLFNGQLAEDEEPYRQWFDEGFRLSSWRGDEAAEWLKATRAFANGNRVEAVQLAEKLCERTGHEKTERFFRRAAAVWPDALKADDLRRLYAESGLRGNQPQPLRRMEHGTPRLQP